MDVILEWRSKAWDVEGEHTSPLFANGASGFGAVSITSAAWEVLLVNFHSLEFAGEFDMVQDASVDVPDATNIELLGVGSFNGIRVSVGAGGHKNEFILATDLIDCDGVAWYISNWFLMMLLVVAPEASEFLH